MNRSKSPDPLQRQQNESFEEQIDILFEELSFAIQWKRPSILLAACASDAIRGKAQAALQRRLDEIGQPVRDFDVDESVYDVPRLLSELPDREGSVFYVTGLSQGGGKDGANAYRALNIRREYFVDYALRVVFWLTLQESAALSLHAPDFWAFRHREVEFIEAASMAYENNADPGAGKVDHLEARLNGLPKDPAVRTERMEILAELAGTYLDLGDDAQSEVQARRGLAISRELADPAWSARFWGMLGDLFLQRGETNRAVRAYRKAVRLSPGTPSLWRQLGHYYHIRKRFPDAIIAYKHAVRLDERDLLSHASLAACYRSLMRHSLSQREMETARPLLENADDYHRAVFEAACGNTGKALDLLERALEKEQVEVGQVRSDPNFDSVRETARFQKLTDVSFHTG